jgi:hypothetical protein
MAGLSDQVPGELAPRIGCAAQSAFPSEHSNRDEKSDFDQESGRHDGDCKKHVVRREPGHSAPHRLPRPIGKFTYVKMVSVPGPV